MLELERISVPREVVERRVRIVPIVAHRVASARATQEGCPACIVTAVVVCAEYLRARATRRINYPTRTRTRTYIPIRMRIGICILYVSPQLRMTSKHRVENNCEESAGNLPRF